jgi:hypothetical protein
MELPSNPSAWGSLAAKALVLANSSPKSPNYCPEVTLSCPGLGPKPFTSGVFDPKLAPKPQTDQ